MKLRYSAEARRHIADIFSYINDRNPAAATQVVTRIRLAAERLAEFPRIGHTGRVPGTYEWVLRSLPYIIVYDISLRERRDRDSRRLPRGAGPRSGTAMKQSSDCRRT